MILLKKIFIKLKILSLDIILFNYLIFIILVRYLIRIKDFLIKKEYIRPKTNWMYKDSKINNIFGIKLLKFIIKQYPLVNAYPIRKKLVDFTYEMF